jgi:hypothetical protein
LLRVYFAYRQNTTIRTPNTAQLKVSPRNHAAGIPSASPVIKQTTPISIAAIPENGTSTPYFIGFSARIMKNTPIPTDIADTVRVTYITNGESGRVSTPKKPAIDSNADNGRNNPTTDSRHKIPAIHRQIFNERIWDSFPLTTKIPRKILPTFLQERLYIRT